MTKIILGTAQFGIKYGISNVSGQVEFNEVKKILKFARECNILELDTAAAYGESEEILGKVGVHDFLTISKLPALPSCVETNIRDWIVREVRNSLSRLRVPFLYGLLLHRPSDILGINKKSYLYAIDELLSLGLVKNFGYSIYSPEELPELISSRKPDIIQSPYNIFDQRLKQSGWLNKLTDKGIAVHARSIFLQGLLLMDKNTRPDYFKKWDTHFDSFSQACNDNKFNSRQLALCFVLNEKLVDRVIVGVESLNQLKEIVNLSKFLLDGNYESLGCNDLLLIEPNRWSVE